MQPADPTSQPWLNRSSLFNPFLFGMVLAAAGIFFLLLAGQVAVLTCTRLGPAQIECTMQRSWLGLGLLPSATVRVHELEEVRVAETCPNRCAHRVEVRGSDGWLPLTPFHGTGAGPKEVVAGQIEAFLADPAASSLRVQDGAGWAILVTVLVIVVGLGLMGFSLLTVRRRAEKTKPIL